MKPIRLFLILSLLLTACDRETEEKTASNAYERFNAKQEPFVLLSPEGDTIPTGVPIPAKGKWINPDSVAELKVVPLKGQPKVLPPHTNVYSAGTPKVVPIPKDLTVITPGKNGVPLPETTLAQGEVASTIYPSLQPALPLSLSDQTLIDVRSMDLGRGLSASRINAMLEDSQGNLWFGTEGGASRYDGSNLLHYTKSEGLSNDNVLCIMEDRRGHLWFGTLGGGVSQYDGERFIHYAKKEGLNDNITVTLEDSQYNLWFGTAGGGVIKYDGSRFTYFTKDEGLSNNNILSILEDSQGNLWFGTAGDGVSKYDGSRFTHYTTDEGLNNNNVWSMLEDKQENLWFGTDSGLNRYDGINFAYYTTEEGLSHNEIRSMIKDSEGNLWFGTKDGGVNLYDGIRFTHYSKKEGLSHTWVRSILEDSQGNMWFGTEGGASRYNRNRFIRHFPEDSLRIMLTTSVLEDTRGNIWLGSRGSGVIVNNLFKDGAHGENFTQYTVKEGLSSNIIKTILEDSRGYVWIGTESGGISRYNGYRNGQKSFTHFVGERGLSDMNVHSILEDSRGDLWFGTRGDGISRYTPAENEIDDGSFIHYTLDEGLSSNIVNTILEDGQGNIWFGTEGGASRYNGNSLTHYTTKEGLIDNRIVSMLEDSRGNIWIGTKGGGVSRYNPSTNNADESFINYLSAEGLSDSIVRTILEDSQGDLWFGTWGDGISRYMPAEDEIDDGSFISYTTKEGLNDNFILCLLEDKEKNIWARTLTGITLLKYLSGKHSLDAGLEKGDYQLINFNNGLRESVYSLNPNCVCLDRHDRIWWVGGLRPIVLDLNRFELSKIPPQVRLNTIEIEQAFIDYRRLSDITYRHDFAFGDVIKSAFDSVVAFYNYPARMVLPHDLNYLTFQFSAIDWAAPHKLKYSYQMEGFEKKWSPPTAENKVNYRNLFPGVYTFKVRAIGEAQIWSEPFTYKFIIRPPWQRSWWAYTFYVALFLTGLYAMYRLQLNRRLAAAETRRLRELNQIKTKLYTNITHEFRTPLTVIQGLTDQIESEAETKKERNIQSKARVVKRNSAQLLGLVNQMLDLRKLESGNLPVHMLQGDMIAYLKYLLESFHSLAETKDIRLHFLSEEKELIMDYDPEKVRHVVSNLLSNAIKFTPEGGDVYVSVVSQSVVSQSSPINHNSLLIFKIRDTGIGVSPEKLPHIFDRFYQVDDESTRKAEGTGVGLTLTKELVKLLEGEISVESEIGKGTTFTILLPIRRDAEKMQDTPALDQEPAPTQANLFSPTAPVLVLPQTQRPLALIVEDNKDVAGYIRSCLETNYRLEMAYNGLEGINKAIELTPDLIISDVMMPEKDGFEVTQSLKNDPRTSHIPIILLTAKADIASKLEGLERGADAYLPKPFNQEELRIRSRKLLELRQKLQSHYLAIAGERRNEGLTSSQTLIIPAEHKIEPAFVLQVRQVIEDHLTDFDFSVEQLAREMMMSRSQLHRKLSALTGYSAVRFIRFIRLNKAKELLQNAELTIGAVAYDSGFSDPVYFARVFKKEFGMTPTEYRAQV